MGAEQSEKEKMNPSLAFIKIDEQHKIGDHLRAYFGKDFQARMTANGVRVNWMDQGDRVKIIFSNNFVDLKARTEIVLGAEQAMELDAK